MSSRSNPPYRFTLLVLSSFVLGCAKPPAPPDPPRPVRTTVVALTAGSETLTQTGEVQPRRETDLGFQIDGRIARRFVDVGDVVAKGKVLAVLDDGLVGNELRAAEAEFSSASSALDLARASLARQKQLFDVQSASVQQLDEADANLRAANAQRDVASVASENATKKLGYTRLFADEPGIVTAIAGNPGQVVAAGQVVVRLASVDRDAVFDVAERVIASAPPDVRVKIALVSNRAITVTGSVREVSPSADPVTRTYRVRIALVNPPPEMVFGAAVTGTVEFPTGRLVALPASALTSDADVPAVYVVDPATKKLERRAVAISRYSGDQILVATGLKPGELVVTAGVSKLRPEQLVALGESEGVAQ